MSENPILVDIADGVTVITLNRPQARNAVTKALAEAVADAVDVFEADSSQRALIITGANNTFCSGMDLKGFVKGETPVVEGRGFAAIAEFDFSKPVIAAVEGYALAGGFEIALSCDLIVAAEDAQFGVPEVKRGLVAAGGGVVRLPNQIPSRIAKEMILTGDFVSAQRAYDLGLINQVVPAGTALDAAKALAAKIAANGPLAVAASKKIADRAQDWNRDEAFANQHQFSAHVFSSADAIEGATAFAEKRAPNWKGK